MNPRITQNVTIILTTLLIAAFVIMSILIPGVTFTGKSNNPKQRFLQSQANITISDAKEVDVGFSEYSFIGEGDGTFIRSTHFTDNNQGEIDRIFKQLNINAKGLHVYDMGPEVDIYNIDADKKRPLASLTKIMTALVTLEDASPGQTVKVTRNALRQLGNYGLYEGEVWNARDIAEFFMINSSNDAAYAAQESISYSLNQKSSYEDAQKFVNSFIQVMNTKGLEIGMKDTFFVNATGFDETGTLSGSFGTPRDVSKLLRYSYLNHGEFFESSTMEKMSFTSESGYTHVANNTNKALDQIPHARISKTGFTNLAGGNLAFVYEARPGRPIAVVIMGSTLQGRFSDARKIVNAVDQVFTRFNTQ